jgi:hypothetical protein
MSVPGILMLDLLAEIGRLKAEIEWLRGEVEHQKAEAKTWHECYDDERRDHEATLKFMDKLTDE